MADLSWEARERLRLAPAPLKPTVTDDLTTVIAVLAKMLTIHDRNARRRRTQ